MKENRMCTRCVFDDTVKNITFDNDGVCNFCHLYDKLVQKPDKSKVNRLFAEIKRKMKHSKYDCIVPFSGGVDSTYALYYVKKAGLRPLVVHFDNGWVTDISRENMRKVVEKLEVPFVKLTIDWEIMRDLYLASLKASVPETCSACEVTALSQILDLAVREGVPYLFYAFSPKTEGIAPLTWHYIDGRYFNSIVKRFAQNKAATLKLNKLGLLHLFYHIVIKGIRYIQLPALIEWDEERIIEVLENEFGWVNKGHHSDCFYYPIVKHIVKKKFNIDRMKISYSAMINAGKMSREEAIKLLQKTDNEDNEDIEDKIKEITERLGITRQELDHLLSLKPKYFTDYSSYYSFLKMIKPLIKLTCRCHILLDDFYYKLFNAG